MCVYLQMYVCVYADVVCDAMLCVMRGYVRTCDSGMLVSREFGGNSHTMSVLHDSSGSYKCVCTCV